MYRRFPQALPHADNLTGERHGGIQGSARGSCSNWKPAAICIHIDEWKSPDPGSRRHAGKNRATATSDAIPSAHPRPYVKLRLLLGGCVAAFLASRATCARSSGKVAFCKVGDGYGLHVTYLLSRIPGSTRLMQRRPGRIGGATSSVPSVAVLSRSRFESRKKPCEKRTLPGASFYPIHSNLWERPPQSACCRKAS